MIHSDAEAAHSNTGVFFSPDDLLSLDGVISQSAMQTAIRHGLKGHVSFTAEDILAFDGIVGKDMMHDIDEYSQSLRLAWRKVQNRHCIFLRT